MKNIIFLIVLTFFISGCFSPEQTPKLHNNTVYEKNDKYYNSGSNEMIFTKEYKYKK